MTGFRIAAALLCLLGVVPAYPAKKDTPATDSRPKPPIAKVVDGNVVIGTGAAKTKVTTSGLDSEALVSPDGAHVAFVRKVKGKQIETAMGGVDASEIWIANVDGSGARRIVAPREGDKVEDTLADFSNFRFSLDGKLLYFTSAGWATSGALKQVDLESGKVIHLAPSNGFELLTRGKYKNHFVSYEHKYGPNGAEEQCWLLSPTGKELRHVGDDLPKAVKRLENE